MIKYFTGDITTPNTDKTKYVAIFSPMFVQGCAETKLQRQMFQEFPIVFWTPSSIPYKTGVIKHSNLLPRNYGMDVINAYLFDKDRRECGLVDAKEVALLQAVIFACKLSANSIRNMAFQQSHYTSMTVRIPKYLGFTKTDFPYDNWEGIKTVASRIFNDCNIHVEIWEHERGKKPIALD